MSSRKWLPSVSMSPGGVSCQSGRFFKIDQLYLGIAFSSRNTQQSSGHFWFSGHICLVKLQRKDGYNRSIDLYSQSNFYLTHFSLLDLETKSSSKISFCICPNLHLYAERLSKLSSLQPSKTDPQVRDQEPVDYLALRARDQRMP